MSITIAKAVGLNAKAVGGNLSNDVIKIQWLLNHFRGLGRFHGAAVIIDGDCGPKTRTAITAFQIQNGLLSEEHFHGQIRPSGLTMQFINKNAGNIDFVPKPPSPSPGIWDNLVTPKDRVEEFAKTFLAELKDGRDSVPKRQKQMKCVLSKLSKPLPERVYRYMAWYDFHAFLERPLPESSFNNRFVIEQWVKKNLKNGLIQKLNKDTSTAAAYKDFKNEVYNSWLVIVKSLQPLNYAYSTDNRYTSDPRAKLLHNWVWDLNGEKYEKHHIYTCLPPQKWTWAGTSTGFQVNLEADEVTCESELD